MTAGNEGKIGLAPGAYIVSRIVYLSMCYAKSVFNTTALQVKTYKVWLIRYGLHMHVDN